jgi:hypothetical protein
MAADPAYQIIHIIGPAGYPLLKVIVCMSFYTSGLRRKKKQRFWYVVIEANIYDLQSGFKRLLAPVLAPIVRGFEEHVPPRGRNPYALDELRPARLHSMDVAKGIDGFSCDN